MATDQPQTTEKVIESLTVRVGQLEEALHRIEQWSVAYPLSVFPELDEEYYRRAHEVLRKNNMALDRLSAAAMRRAVKGVGKIAREALK